MKYLCLIMIFTWNVIAAEMSIVTPNTVNNPGAILEVDLVVTLAPSDMPVSQDTAPVIKMNVVWPDGITIFEPPVWNNSQIFFTDQQFVQTSTSACLWITAQPKFSYVAPNIKTVIAKLKCQITGEVNAESFYYDTSTNTSYATSIFDNGGHDILGSPTDPHDGVDELSISAPNIASYNLRVLPESSSVPFASNPLRLDFELNKGCNTPNPYDHLRFVLMYDSDVLKIQPNSLTNGLASYFYDLKFNTIMFTNLGVISEIGAYVEASCPPTNINGVVVSWLMDIIDIEEELDLEFEIGDPNHDTILEYKYADMLGLITEDDDGCADAIVSIRNSDTLRVDLRPESSTIIVASQSFARVVLAKDIDFSIKYDYIMFNLEFDTNIIDAASFTFDLNPLLTNVIFSSAYSTNAIKNPLLNASKYYQFTFTNTQTFVGHLFELGKLNFVPSKSGKIDFDSPDSYIEFNMNDIHDQNQQDAAFPIYISALAQSEIDSQLFASLSNPKNVFLGDNFEVDIMTIGSIVTNAEGFLSWVYDARKCQFVSANSGNISTGTVANLSGSNFNYFAISVNNFTAIATTSSLGQIVFKSIGAGAAHFNPIFSDTYLTNSHLMVGAHDILGSSDDACDGIANANTIIHQTDSFLVYLEPTTTLYYGGKLGEIGLIVNNPESLPWDNLKISLLLAEDQIITTNDWIIEAGFSIVSNFFKSVDIISPQTNMYGELYTNTYTYAYLECQASSTITNDALVARLGIIPLETEPTYYLASGLTNTPISSLITITSALCHNDVVLSKPTSFYEPEWLVNPPGIFIYLEDQLFAPILCSNYTIKAFISNPNNYDISGARVCWSFDSYVLKIKDYIPSSNFAISNIVINNYNDGEGYFTADFNGDVVYTNAKIELAEITIFPYIVEPLEIFPDEDILPYFKDSRMDVHGPNKLNYLETMDQDMLDLCPTWRRYIGWQDVPQLMFYDMYLDINEVYTLDLDYEGEGLINYKDTSFYRWWVDPSEHVTVDFNFQNRTATIKPELNYSGFERVTIYCQEIGSSYIATYDFFITIGDDWENPINLVLQRDEYITSTEFTFTEFEFDIFNVKNNLKVEAFIIKSGVTNYPTIVLEPSDSSSNSYHGQLIWDTPVKRGVYYTTIRVSCDYNIMQKYIMSPSPSSYVITECDSAIAFITTTPTEEDWDGDRLIALYNGNPIDVDDLTIRITSGSDDDMIKCKIIKDKDSDGVYDIDSIISDHGFKKISLRGSVNYIETDGPIGNLTVRGGYVGQLIVKRGDLGKMILKPVWDPYYEDWTDVYCYRGVSVQGEIGSLIIIGGGFGTEDEPALIESKTGSIKAIITKQLVRRLHDSGYVFVETSSDDGANLYGSVLALNGSIGKILLSGGSLGIDADYFHTIVQAKFGIKNIQTKAVKGDYEIFGGFIHSDIATEGDISSIKALGGDICGSPETEDGEYDYIIEFPVSISANSIKKIDAIAKVHSFSDGDPDFREWGLRGGNIGLVLNLNLDVAKINAKGGNISTMLNSLESIGSIITKGTKYQPDPESELIYVGGNIVGSIIAPNNAYRSNNPADYKGWLKKIKVEKNIINSWLGLQETFVLKNAKFEKLVNSEIWSAGSVIASD